MFLSRRYRPNKWPFYVLVCIEGSLTIGLLALFGIASPNLYRTRLWQDGSDNGFNSNPNAALYAAANYRPYKTPKPWSQFITDYNVIISVLSTFILLTKTIMYILHVFPPILSVIVHAILIALYAVSISYQAGSDTSDPKHPQTGPPWYITKSCSVTHSKSNIGYCKQAKAAFACTVVAIGLFFIYFCFAVWSCFPSKQQREYYNEKAEKARLRKEAKARAMAEYEAAESARKSLQPEFSFSRPKSAGTTGGLKSPNPPVTPRTLAFNKLGGTSDLPLRNHFSSPNQPKSPGFAMRSPTFPRTPMGPGFDNSVVNDEESGASNTNTNAMYFPPPPKISAKK